MTPVNFAYWLQGFFEITENSETKQIVLTNKQIEVIRAHLNLVFFHAIDADNLKDYSDADAVKYQKIHDGAKSGDRLSAEDVKRIYERLSERSIKPSEQVIKKHDFPHATFADSEVKFNC